MEDLRIINADNLLYTTLTRDVADVLGHKDIETTENYYISSTDETRKNVTDSYESTINLDVIDEIIEYKISI